MTSSNINETSDTINPNAKLNQSQNVRVPSIQSQKWFPLRYDTPRKIKLADAFFPDTRKIQQQYHARCLPIIEIVNSAERLSHAVLFTPRFYLILNCWFLHLVHFYFWFNHFLSSSKIIESMQNSIQKQRSEIITQLFNNCLEQLLRSWIAPSQIVSKFGFVQGSELSVSVRYKFFSLQVMSSDN